VPDAAISHAIRRAMRRKAPLRFVTPHPFDDGSSQRFYRILPAATFDENFSSFYK